MGGGGGGGWQVGSQVTSTDARAAAEKDGRGHLLRQFGSRYNTATF